MAETFKNKIYSACIYARLSVSGDDRKNESIDTQIEIAKEYLGRQKDMVLYDCYTDLGKTGTDFKREGFERMMKDIRMHKVDCVIVKDLSRFGRNHIETGNYIEKIFPFLGVRFIAVTDDFDSMHISGENEHMGMNLKNLVNEMYARDIAVKVKAGKMAKWEQGSYIGGIPPYGYRSELINGNKRLIIEEKASDVIKKIYNLFLSGKNMKEIAVWLYREEILRPTEYRRTGHIYKQEDDVLQEWSRGTVRQILTNPIYTGCLVKCGINGKDCCIKRHTHEAIISENEFMRVSEKFEQTSAYCKKDDYSGNVSKDKDIFEGIIFCGDCGSKMRRVSFAKELSSGNRITTYGYLCPNAGRIDKFRCEKKYIPLKTLTSILKTSLWQEIALSDMRLKDIVERNKCEGEKIKENLKVQFKRLETKIESLRINGSEQYKDYRMGVIDIENFKNKKRENQEKIHVMQKMQTEISEKLILADEETVKLNEFICDLFQCGNRIELTEDSVKAFVHRIEVYPDKRIKIIFAFQKKEAE